VVIFFAIGNFSAISHLSFRHRRVCFELEAALGIPSARRRRTSLIFALKEMIEESGFRVKHGMTPDKDILGRGQEDFGFRIADPSAMLRTGLRLMEIATACFAGLCARDRSVFE